MSITECSSVSLWSCTPSTIAHYPSELCHCGFILLFLEFYVHVARYYRHCLTSFTEHAWGGGVSVFLHISEVILLLSSI